MKTVRGVAVLYVLPGKVPSDPDRIADSLAGINDATGVCFDMSGVDHVNSLFLARLVQLHRRIHLHNGRLVLFSLDPQVREIMDSARLDRLFDIADDEEAALASL